MSFGTAVKTVFSKYATFSGRARRSEFWFWYLFFALTVVVLGAVVGGVAAGSVDPATGTIGAGFWGAYAVLMLVLLALFLPTLAAMVRRLHDTGRSGFWYFIVFVPLAGPIILLVFLAGEGNQGPNQFGPDPKLTATPAQAQAPAQV